MYCETEQCLSNTRATSHCNPQVGIISETDIKEDAKSDRDSIRNVTHLGNSFGKFAVASDCWQCNVGKWSNSKIASAVSL